MKSRHIIVHLIRGAAKEAHEAMTRGLVETLDAFPIHDHVVPHLTLKRWFELDQAGIEEVYKVLDTFVTTQTQSGYRLHGLNNFGEGVIYIGVDSSKEMSQGARDLMAILHTVKDMTFDEIDAIEDNFHATVAMRALKPFNFKQTWDYLQAQEALDFNLNFDNIALLKKEGEKWVPARIWEIPTLTEAIE
jgi:2'-5' RNA ligase